MKLITAEEARAKQEGAKEISIAKQIEIINNVITAATALVKTSVDVGEKDKIDPDNLVLIDRLREAGYTVEINEEEGRHPFAKEVIISKTLNISW